MDLSKFYLHDLTRTYDREVAGFSDSVAKSLEVDGWNAKWLQIYSHSGTHMDAPLHFGVEGYTIDRFPLDFLMGKAFVSRIELHRSKQLLQVDDLGPIAPKISAGDSLLLQTGWSDRHPAPAFRDDLPRISEDLANWIVENRIKILGVEAPSVADVNNLEELTTIHRILFEGKVVVVEGLKNLARIKSDEVFLIALPLKIKDGDGAPARVIALENKSGAGG